MLQGLRPGYPRARGLRGTSHLPMQEPKSPLGRRVQITGETPSAGCPQKNMPGTCPLLPNPGTAQPVCPSPRGDKSTHLQERRTGGDAVRCVQRWAAVEPPGTGRDMEAWGGLAPSFPMGGGAVVAAWPPRG